MEPTNVMSTAYRGQVVTSEETINIVGTIKNGKITVTSGSEIRSDQFNLRNFSAEELKNTIKVLESFLSVIGSNVVAKVEASNPDYKQNNGVIRLYDVEGGVAPHTVIWSDAPGLDNTTFERINLGAGTYFATIKDATGMNTRTVEVTLYEREA